MPHLSSSASPAAVDGPPLQDALLQGVSRTFALTIPQLPPALRLAVGNAYLLCRIVDTIEDEPTLDSTRKRELALRFVAAVEGENTADALAADIGGCLSANTLEAERELIRRLSAVLAITRGLSSAERAALTRCVRTMTEGMLGFQDVDTGGGLPDRAALSHYCYCVAGVVGELLTELFCLHIPALAGREAELRPLAVAFGEGLQLTNILKDVWEDRARGACWLPREVFERHGVSLPPAAPDDPGYQAALRELLGQARARLRDALDYTLAIPAAETGVRNFCLWALAMALLTLRRIHRRPDYRSGSEVKISRREVGLTITVSRLTAGHDACLRGLFALLARGLPPARVGA